MLAGGTNSDDECFYLWPSCLCHPRANAARTEPSTRSVSMKLRARWATDYPSTSPSIRLPNRSDVTRQIVKEMCLENSQFTETPLFCADFHIDRCFRMRIGRSVGRRASLGACSLSAGPPRLRSLVTLQTRRHCWRLASATSSKATRQRNEIVRAHTSADHRSRDSYGPHGALV